MKSLKVVAVAAIAAASAMASPVLAQTYPVKPAMRSEGQLVRS